jgi:tetratricopeptide (TPR) repeat protein
MKGNRHDVVIFPGWKKQLEEDGLAALKEKRYNEALELFEKLEEYESASFEILTGKVMCLIELARYEEAIEVCERLMREDDSNYYTYLHIYVTILFQTSKYGEIVTILDEILSTENVPHTYREQFWQLFDISKKLYEDHQENSTREDVQLFIQKLENGSFLEQWRMISILRKNPVQKYVQELLPYLSREDIHPVIKTALIQWFMEQKVERNIEIKKFGQTKIINPIYLKDLMDYSFAKQVLYNISDIEQQNPSLYELAKQVLSRFLFIYFPFFPDEEDIPYISEAIINLAKDYLQMKYPVENDERVLDWMTKIKNLEEKYYSSIDGG